MRIFILITILTICLLYKGDRIDLHRDWMKYNNIECLDQINAADSLIALNKLVLCQYTCDALPNYLRAQTELVDLLKKYNIYFQYEYMRCVIMDHKECHCFCEIMLDEIFRRYGKKFIDSLANLADYQFTLKNLDKVFDNRYRKETDEPAIFPGDKTEDNNGLQKEFDKIVKYPEDYQYNDGGEISSAFIEVYIETDTLGRAKVNDIIYDFYNGDTEEENINGEFYPYFGKLIDSIVEHTKWKPARIRSFYVNSKMRLF